MLGMATNTKYSYPQKYFLIPEACRHFGLKERTLKSWRETGITIPGLLWVLPPVVKTEELAGYLVFLGVAALH